jgi:hypothetical protein
MSPDSENHRPKYSQQRDRVMVRPPKPADHDANPQQKNKQKTIKTLLRDLQHLIDEQPTQSGKARQRTA